jgi:hypothetical protein
MLATVVVDMGCSLSQAGSVAGIASRQAAHEAAVSGAAIREKNRHLRAATLLPSLPAATPQTRSGFGA